MIKRLWEYLCRYETSWFPVIQIVGRDMYHGATYLTRFHLTPETRWGRLYLHRFHREDLDRDPHDHPFNFWTLPINQGYFEEVLEHAGACINTLHVPRFRWSHRPATHRHRIVLSDSGRWPLWTLVWRGPNVRDWGFWVYDERAIEICNRPHRSWVRWQSYVSTDRDTSTDTALDDICPGTIQRDHDGRQVPTLARPGWSKRGYSKPGQM